MFCEFADQYQISLIKDAPFTVSSVEGMRKLGIGPNTSIILGNYASRLRGSVQEIRW